MIELKIDPMGAVRMTQKDKWKPIAQRYLAYKRDLFFLAMKNKYKLKNPLSLTFNISMPNSWTKKKRREMVGMPHKSRPDLDNLIKAVMDALAFEDSYIHEFSYIRKVWAKEGSIEIHSP